MRNTEIDTLDTKLETLSEKYKLVPTKSIAEQFYAMGFIKEDYQAVRVRKKSKEGYQKHIVRLSNPTLLSSAHNDVKLQLVVTNSHDGLSAFKIQLGIYRLVCSNGLMVGRTFESIALRHTGNVIEQVEKSIERMVAQVNKLDAAITLMKQKTLTPEQTTQFVARAIALRYPDKSINDVELTIRRDEDKENNVFTLYNRIQEDLVRGGNEVRNNQNRFRRARNVTSIDKLTKLNEGLFDLASEFSQAA